MEREVLQVRGVLDHNGVRLEISARPTLPGDAKTLGVLSCKGRPLTARIEFSGAMEGGEPGAEERAREALLWALEQELDTRAGRVQEMRQAFDKATGREPDRHSMEYFERQQAQAQA